MPERHCQTCNVIVLQFTMICRKTQIYSLREYSLHSFTKDELTYVRFELSTMQEEIV